MKIALAQIKESADQAMAGGNAAAALRLYTVLVREVPDDPRARLALADALAQLQYGREAAAVYRITAEVCIDGGHPLVGIIACRTLAAQDQPADDLIWRLAQTYGRGSERVGTVGARLSARYEGTVSDKEFRGDVPLRELLPAALAAGRDRSGIGELPQRFPPVPILSQLSAEVMNEAIPEMVVHRLPAGHPLIRAGDLGTSCYLVASGRLSVRGEDDVGQPRELATLVGGALVGEMALITGSPRLADVVVTEPADVIEIGPPALAAIGDQLDELAPVLDKMARHRWMRNLLEQSPLFRIFEPEQRQDLLKRCSAHEVPKGTILFQQGESAKGLYLLLRGHVMLAREVQKGRGPVQTLLSPGAVAGVSALGNGEAEMTAKTTTPSTLLFLSRRFVHRLIEAVPEFADAVRQVAAHRDRITRPPI